MSVVKEEVYNSIGNMSVEKACDNRIYNLSGMVMNTKGKLPKGVYIKNGRKIVVR